MDELLDRLRTYCESGYGRQTEVSREIKVSRQRINDWLAGRVKPTGEQTLALLEFLSKRIR